MADLTRNLVVLVLGFCAFTRTLLWTDTSVTSVQQIASREESNSTAVADALNAALQEKDLKARAAMFESILWNCPHCDNRERVLEMLVDLYGEVGDTRRMGRASDRLLQLNPNSLKGLFGKVTALRFEDMGDAEKNADESLRYSKKGLDLLRNATNPPSINKVEFEKMKASMTAKFGQVAGMVLLQRNRPDDARHYLLESVHSNPNIFASVYPLALAYLRGNPPDTANGLFFLARAARLAPNKAAGEQLDSYGKKECTSYYKSEMAWNAVKAIAATNAVPPAGFDLKATTPK
jgi:hypothetical protein